MIARHQDLLLAPSLDGEGLGRGDFSAPVAFVAGLTPTRPSPIEGEGICVRALP
jgi:hypothetical protein